MLSTSTFALWIFLAGVALVVATPGFGESDTTSSRAPLRLPQHLQGDINRLRRKDLRSSPEEDDSGHIMREREWLIMIKKAYRDDFVAVLEDMGRHLAQRFGMHEWFDLKPLREARQQRLRASDGGQDPGKEDAEELDVRQPELGLMALEMDKRLVVQLTVPRTLAEREVDVLESLRDMPWTEFIEPNLVVRAEVETASEVLTSSDAFEYPWGVDRVDQRSLPLDQSYTYALPTHNNVVVYVVDSGIRASHQEFGGRASFGANFVRDGIDEDCNGHGTHVAGTIGGATLGLAKNVSIVGVKALNCKGDATAFKVVYAIKWAVTNCASRPEKPKCLISLSLGSKSESDVVDHAVALAYQAGVVVVSAAGNDNTDACRRSPARSPYSITVAASTSRDGKASFSNWGSCVDLWAPGVQIPSAYNLSDTSRALLSGTSQATPHVSGAVALFLSTVNSSTPSEVAGALYASATLDALTSTGETTVNRLLYSLINVAATDVTTTGQAACQRLGAKCRVTAKVALANSTHWESELIDVDDRDASSGYLQAWLEATTDFDLELRQVNVNSTSSTLLATSSSGSGHEWIQYSSSASGGGQYFFRVTAQEGSGTFTLFYELPSAAQAGSPRVVANSAASAAAPVWLFPLSLLLLILFIIR